MKLNENVQISAQKCDLVPYEKCHVAKYHKWMENEELRRLTGSERLSLEEEYEMQRNWREDEDKLTFIVLEKADGQEEDRMIGDVNLFITNGEEAEVEVMIAEEKGRKKGVGREAASLIISYAINNLQIRKFCVKITDDNTPSITLFEQKLGFDRISHSSAFKEYTFELPEHKIDEFQRFLEENGEISNYQAS
uniref:N-acetyltransferase domain-containing protein n=1 Tax=Caenorhabditis japonica TaxID=281687 RepID=A0A8R1DX79_CAEJA